MLKKALSMFALFILSVACGLVAGWMLGTGGGVLPAIGAIASSLFAVGLAWAARRLSAWVWVAAGLLILVGLALPTPTISGDFAARLPQPVVTLVQSLVFLIPGAALILAALLLHSGLVLRRRRQEAQAGAAGQHKPSGWLAAACLALFVVLIATTLYSLYWITVWDNTGDSIGYILIFVPVLAALFAALMLAWTLPGWTKLAGLGYGVCVPAILIAISASAQQVDYRLLTEARAERVSQALEAYRAREGRYPQELRQLTPWTLPTIPGPVILYGQGWCYDGGVEYYRLGAVTSQHWSDPRLSGQLYRTKGAIPDLPGICEGEITALIQRYPEKYTRGP